MIRHRLRRADAGVTLIEMMIVLAVIGVATGAATLGLGALNRDDLAEQSARRLATVIGLAVDDALISGVPQTLLWDPQGYQIGTGMRQTLAPSLTLARGDESADALSIMPDASSPAVTFVLQGAATPWRVEFDGLTASVTAEAGP